MPDAEPRILVAEDDLLISMDLEDMLEQLGCAVVGPFGGVDAALAAARDLPLDGGVLDVNLGGERVWPLAELLEERSVPFVLATGYGTAEVPERFAGQPILAKPLSLEALRAGLQRSGLVLA